VTGEPASVVAPAPPAFVPADPRLTGAWPPPSRRELLALAGILAIATLLRFAFLLTRGEFDLDQGHDMLVLHDLVTAGVVPLLGPPTSVGAGHHGAVWYYLLAPAALLDAAGDPLPVVALLAALGVAAVALTWWLARSIGGPVAGIVAAVVIAGSATSIQASTFIWNPSPMAASSALAFVAARKAWRDDAPAWWLLAAAGAMLTMQLHWLGALIVPPLAALWLAQAIRAGGAAPAGGGPHVAGTASGRRRRVLLAGLGAAAILAAGYLPLAIHEVTAGFSETRVILDYLAGGGTGATLDPITRMLVALLRSIGWPLAGPMVDAPAATLLAFLLVAGTVIWRLVRGRGDERAMVAWLGGTVAYASAALGLFVTSASVVTPLPTDHYHAWLDPLVAAIVGIGIAALVAVARRRGATSVAAGRIAAAVVVVGVVGAIVAWDVTHVPPAVSPRGDWSAARGAADRIIAATPSGGIGFLALPSFKGADAYAYPLTVSGRAPVDPSEAATVVVLCEDLWVDDCGGPAEERALEKIGGSAAFDLVERLRPAPGRTMTILTRR
jgi:hypothetical protein